MSRRTTTVGVLVAALTLLLSGSALAAPLPAGITTDPSPIPKSYQMTAGQSFVVKVMNLTGTDPVSVGPLTISGKNASAFYWDTTYTDECSSATASISPTTTDTCYYDVMFDPEVANPGTYRAAVRFAIGGRTVRVALIGTIPQTF